MATNCDFSALLFFWSTEKVLHPIDSASITLVALGIILMPKIGVITWKVLKEDSLGDDYSIWCRNLNLVMYYLKQEPLNG